MTPTPSLLSVGARLDTHAPRLMDVGFAADFAAAFEKLPRSPAAFVLPAAHRADKPETVRGFVRQRETVTFTVAIGLGRTGRRGDAGIEALEPVRDDVRDALLGHVLPGATSAIRLAGQRMLAFDLARQQLFWAMSFAFDHQLRKDT